MERITIMANHGKAELAHDGDLVHGDLGEIDDECRLGDIRARLADDPLVGSPAQDHDAFRRRLVGDDREVFGRPDAT